MRYTIGLDVGTASVGWAIINNDLNRIEDLGVRVFESAENSKDGESLAKPRREARSLRRRLDRRGYRLNRIKSLFQQYDLLTENEIIQAHSIANNPYEIRTKALDKIVSDKELFISIYHIAKRRGYKSNRKKADEGDDEARVVLSSAKRNKELLSEKYRTAGEMLFKDELFIDSKRNKGGSYKKCILRESLINEVETILIKQKELGNKKITNEFYNDIVDAVSHQKPFASGDDIKNKVGNCIFEKEEMRAAKATPSFQLFNFLQKINHIKIKNKETGEERSLSDRERQLIIEKAYNQKKINFNSLRKSLNLSDKEKFNINSYFIKKKEAEDKTEEEIIKTIETKEKIPSLETIYIFKDKFSDYWNEFKDKRDVLDKTAEILTIYKTDSDITKHLEEIKLPSEVIDNLLSLSFNKFGHLSLKALNKIIPFLEEGFTYDESCKKAGYDFKASGKNQNYKLPPIDKEEVLITNPVVKRSVSQTIKVVNAIIDRFGSPESVNIELARDLNKDLIERRNIQKIQKENRENNEKAKESIEENFKLEQVRGQDIIRMRLYKEQNGKCIYSGKTIDENRLFEDGYTEIDHIIPFSRSFNDSFNNKVLVFSSSNQDKLNRSPYEWLGGDENIWKDFEARVLSMKGISYRKRQNLLTKKVAKDDLITRSLNDTRYASKFLKNYIQRNLKFSESDKKNKVLTINGQATAYIRKRLGLNKDRQENDRHHAQDAVIAATVNPALINKINRFAKYKELSKYLECGKKLDRIKDEEEKEFFDREIIDEAKNFVSTHNRRFSFKDEQPWDTFSHEVRARMSDDPINEIKTIKNRLGGYKDCLDLSFIRPIFVSRMPKRKVTGPAHAETLKSPKGFNKGKLYSSVKTPLNKIKLKDIDNIAGGEKLLKEALRKRLEKYDNDPQKAFSEDNPFYKPNNDGTNGPLVRSIRLIDKKQKSGLLINDKKALVDQQSMIRIDIFSKADNKGKKKYYIIPVYAYHFAGNKLPNKVVVSGKPESEWLEIDESYDFMFSLYPNDLVKLVKGSNEKFGYYISCNRAIAAIDIKSHDSSEYWQSNGIKTLDKIEKYVVDILGRCHPVRKEKRQGINIKGRHRNSDVLENS
ncbi:MAG: type II CRISPR RNA-guided endonuclease Cas9 [Candidatus Paceibacterota bacterium]